VIKLGNERRHPRMKEKKKVAVQLLVL